MRRSGTIGQTAGFGPRSHLCWVHEGDQEWRDAAVPFLHDGVAGRERLLYVADGGETELLADLAGLPGREELLASGQLMVVPLAQAYGPLQTAGADEQVESVHARVRSAVEAGFQGLRLAADASPLFVGEQDLSRFAAYEFRIDGLVNDVALSSLCGYDRQQMGASAAATMRFVHPLRGDTGDASGALHPGDDGKWALTGEVDATVCDALQTALAALPPDGVLRLDLAGLEFIDVAATRALVEAAARRPPPGRLVLHHPPAMLRRMLAICWPGASGLEVATV